MSLQSATSPTWMLWVGRILGVPPILLLTFSGVMKILGPEDVRKGFAEFGYPEHLALPIGIVELVCVVLYVFPHTAVLGAILITGYLGGATATHVRTETAYIMPILVGVVVWLALYFRDARLRALVPLRRTPLTIAPLP